MMTVQGFVEPGFEPVREAFGAIFDTFGEQGAAVAGVVGSTTVVDLWGGTADAGTAWQRGTTVNTFSVTKPLVAATVLA